MAFTFGFYNSVGGDRRYNAEHFQNVFDGLIRDGVYAAVENIFATRPGDGLQVVVDTGRAWLSKTWNHNSAPFPINITPPDVTLPRIDTVCIEVNHEENVRGNRIRVIQGIPASTPQPPTLVRSELVNQWPLADITVRPNASAFTALDINILVGTPRMPFVTGIIQTHTIESLWDQWQAHFDVWFEESQFAFNVWFAEVMAIMGDDVATMLLNRIQTLEGRQTPILLGGSANVYTGSTTFPLSAYVDGLRFPVRAGTSNTVRDITININGVRPVPIRSHWGSGGSGMDPRPEVGEFAAGGVYWLEFNAGVDAFIIMGTNRWSATNIEATTFPPTILSNNGLTPRDWSPARLHELVTHRLNIERAAHSIRIQSLTYIGTDEMSRTLTFAFYPSVIIIRPVQEPLSHIGTWLSRDTLIATRPASRYLIAERGFDTVGSIDWSTAFPDLPPNSMRFTPRTVLPVIGGPSLPDRNVYNTAGQAYCAIAFNFTGT